MRSAIFKNNHRGLIIAAVAAISMVAAGFALPASVTTGVPRLLPLAVKGALSITAPGSQGLRPLEWCSFPGFERRIVDVKSHRGMVSENRSKLLTKDTNTRWL